VLNVVTDQARSKSSASPKSCQGTGEHLHGKLMMCSVHSKGDSFLIKGGRFCELRSSQNHTIKPLIETMLSQLASLVRLLPILSAAVLVAGQTQDPEAIWAQVCDPLVGEHISQLMHYNLISDYSEQ
jgi:hypothetical protein